MQNYKISNIFIFLSVFIISESSMLFADSTTNSLKTKTINGVKILCGSVISTQEVEYVYDEYVDEFDRLDLMRKPAVFGSWTERLDFIHNNLSCEMQHYVDKADVMFADCYAPKKNIPASRFRLGMYSEFEENGGVKVRLAPDVDADIRIPNIEERLRLFIDTSNSDDLPGTTVMERERGFNAGLRKVTHWFRYDAGIKVRFLPVVFGRIDWRPQWRVSEWKVNPLGRIYWESDDGYGVLASLSAYQYISKHVLVRSITAVKWTEKSNSEGEPPEDPEEYYKSNASMEWEQSFMCGYIGKILSSKDIGKAINMNKVAMATGLRLSVFGNTERVGGADRIRLSLGHRRPIYKDWMFLMITPELEWCKEKDWEFVSRIRVGVDMLFSVGDVQRNR